MSQYTSVTGHNNINEMLINTTYLCTIYTVGVYHLRAIVGNFRGEKFQDFLLSKTFHKLNVKDLLHYHCACITIHGKSQTFAVARKFHFSLENFR